MADPGILEQGGGAPGAPAQDPPLIIQIKMFVLVK